MPSLTRFTPILRALPKVAAPRSAASLLRASAPAARAYATPAGTPASGSSATKYALGLLAVGGLAGAAYYGLAGEAAAPVVEKLDYQKVYNAIAASLDAEDYDDGSYGPVLVRLAWHSSGTYDKRDNTGGSNGAQMRVATGCEANHACNAGLIHARNHLEPIKAQFPQISYSDLWVLGGIAAVAEMGGPLVRFRAGRADLDHETCAPDGRLPDGDKGSDHLRYIFYKMGFNDQEIVALSGSHCLGACHSDRSKFLGNWDYSPTTMTNNYFKNLFEMKWTNKKWDGPIQLENKKKDLMMLTTDMAMITDKVFKPWSRLYADDEARFFADFSAAYEKLLELGVPAAQFSEYIPLMKTEDQPKVVVA